MRHVQRAGRVAMFMVCLTAALAAPSAASPAAAAPSASSSSVPLVQGPISVQIGPDEETSTTVALVDVSLDASIKLPARVRIPVPPGGSVRWAGEILGGDSSTDLQRQYVLHDGTGGQYVEFTVTQSRLAQIDTGVAPLKLNGSAITGKVDFVESVPSTSTSFTVLMPAGVSQVTITPAPVALPESNSAGESLYSLGSQSLSPGGKLTVTYSYNTTLEGAGASSTSSQTPIFVTLGIALVGVIVALALLLQRGYRANRGRPQGDGAGLLDDSDETVETNQEQDAPGSGASEEPPRSDAAFDDDDPFSSANTT